MTSVKIIAIGEGEKWCDFEYTDKSREDETVSLVEDRYSFTLNGNAGYSYTVKLVDVSVFSANEGRAVIELDKVVD